jgi:hypothetical protein
MLSISKDANKNYLAKVVKLPTPISHPNADKLQGFVIDGNRVWSGLTAQQGDIYVYFPLECAIHERLLSVLNLYSDASLNADPKIRGYFPSTGRVKAVRLRGEPSEGFLLPLREIEEHSMGFLGEGEYSIGQEFDTWDGHLLVWKYVPKSSNTSSTKAESSNTRKKVNKFNRLVDDQFRLHEDTQQLKKNLHKLSPEDTISISYKLHGTSFVVGNILVKRKLNWKEKFTKWLGIDVKDTEYDLIYSSRNVVKNKYINTQANGGYYQEDLWGDIKDYLAPSIQKGMTIYGECVGYTRSGKAIQKGYDYGYVQPTPEHYAEGVHMGVYIYRITQTNVDGKVTEFSTQQIVEYCEKYGLKTVPIIHSIDMKSIGADNSSILDGSWRDILLDQLMTDKELGYQNVDCYMCKNKVPAEGVVVRKENLFTFEAYKLKSFKFLERESKELDTGEVDMETAQTIVDDDNGPG